MGVRIQRCIGVSSKRCGQATHLLSLDHQRSVHQLRCKSQSAGSLLHVLHAAAAKQMMHLTHGPHASICASLSSANLSISRQMETLAIASSPPVTSMAETGCVRLATGRKAGKIPDDLYHAEAMAKKERRALWEFGDSRADDSDEERRPRRWNEAAR